MAAKMQDLALAEGALPRHLHTAMYTHSTDSRLLTNRYPHGDFIKVSEINESVAAKFLSNISQLRKPISVSPAPLAH